MLPVWGLMMVRLFGRDGVGEAFGVMNPAMMPITGASPLVWGYLHDETGNYDLAFQIFLLVFLLAGVLLYFLKLPEQEGGVG